MTPPQILALYPSRVLDPLVVLHAKRPEFHFVPFLTADSIARPKTRASEAYQIGDEPHKALLTGAIAQTLTHAVTRHALVQGLFPRQIPAGHRTPP